MSRQRLIALTLLGGALLGLTACASEDEPHYREVGRGGFGRGGGGDAAAHRPGVPNLFISPEGKPWRAGPDQPYPMATWFAAADANRDGKLTQDEFRKAAEGFFHELDTNQDGVVDGFEVQAYEQKVAPEILPRVEGLAAGEGTDTALGRRGGGRRGEGGGGQAEIGGSRAARPNGKAAAGDQRPQGAGVYGLLNEPEPVAAADSNFNGKITLEQWNAASDRRFAALDPKGLGYLTLTELPKTPAQEALEREAQRRAKANGALPRNS